MQLSFPALRERTFSLEQSVHPEHAPLPQGVCAMRRLVVGLVWVAALATAGLVPEGSDACGRRGCCESYCGSAPCAAPCVVAPVAPTFEERTITCLKPVWR